MSEKELLEKQNELLNTVKGLKNSFRKSLNVFIAIYAILLLFVICYTSYVYSQVSRLATPSSIAQLFVNKVQEQLPRFRQDIRQRMTPMADQIATSSLDAAADMVPSLGQYARNLITAKADEALDEFKVDHFPIIEKSIDEAVGTILADKGKIKERTLGDELTVVVVDSANREMDKLINKDFYASVSDLQSKLNSLRTKPVKSMTRREFAEFSFILCWVRLNEISRSSGEDTGVIGSLASIAELFSSSLANAVGEQPASK